MPKMVTHDKQLINSDEKRSPVIFVSLFEVLRLTQECFTEDVTIAGRGVPVLTFARQSWPLNSEGSLACHTTVKRGIPL